jgi:uncharacterized protein YdhG (YjbR/CyaY superfamily)
MIMADTTKFTSVDEYLATFDGPVRERLEAVRQVFAETLPEAEEVISYNIPAFRQDGMFVVYFSGHKAHISIACYPTERLYESLHQELQPYKKSKSAFQLPHQQPLPIELLRTVATFKVNDNAAIKDGTAR